MTIKPTTVQVSPKTLRMLEMAKDRLGLASYEETIRELLHRQLGIPESLAGAYPELQAWDKDRESNHL